MRIMKNAWYKWQVPRNEDEDSLPESLAFTEKNTLDFFRHIDKYAGSLPEEDQDWLSANSPMSSGLFAPQDLHIKVSERVKHLERPDFWLGKEDKDWHIPIL